MIKVLSVFGTRPEAIKMAPLVKELERRENIDSIVCITAQHREMLDQVLEIFDIKPDFDLNIMQTRQTLSGITTSALNGLSEVIAEAVPDIVLVHGDTTTTFAGSLAAFYNKVKVGHVEAGLRTYNNYSPYPEEVNRKLTGVLAELHFAPTNQNRENLLKENVSENGIYITGNTVIDALKDTVSKEYVFENEILSNLDYSKKIIVVTAHRRENLGQPLHNICNAIKRVAREFGDVEFVYPVHLNPAVQEVAHGILADEENVHLIDPVNATDLHNLMARSFMVMTDSGGLQEEAPSLGKPVLVMRTETERPEAVKAGTVKVVGVEAEDVYQNAKKLLTDVEAYDKMAKAVNPYGDGEASRRIADIIEYTFGTRDENPDEWL